MSTDQMQRDGLSREVARLSPGGAQSNRTLGRKGPAQDDAPSQYQINWRLLAASIVAVVILAPSAYFWHNRQLRRNGSVFLDHADTLEADGQWSAAAEDLYRYIRLFPEDPDTDPIRIRLAETFDRGATTWPAKARAIELYSSAIGLDQKRTDLRARQAELEFEYGLYRDPRYLLRALDHARNIVEKAPNDPLATRLKAQTTYLLNKDHLSDLMPEDLTPPSSRAKQSTKTRRPWSREVERLYLDALKYAKEPSERISLTIRLASIYREDLEKLKQPGAKSLIPKADKLVDQLVEQHPNDVDAFVARYDYRQKYQRSDADKDAYDKDLDRALELDKDHKNVAACLRAGERARSRQLLEEAIGYFNQAIAAAPRDLRGYHALATTYVQRRDFQKAIQVCRDGLKKVGVYDAFPLQLLLGKALLNDGQLSGTGELLDELDRQMKQMGAGNTSPQANRLRAGILILRGQWLIQRREFGAAEEAVQKALDTLPGSIDTDRERAEDNFLLGNCRLALQKWDQAAAAFEETVRLLPNSLEANLSAARALQSAKRLAEAIQFYEQAVNVPNSTELAWVGLTEAKLLQQAKRPVEQRDWVELEHTLGDAKKAYPNSLALEMLEARMAELRGGSGQILGVLEKAHAKNPKSAMLVERLMLAYEQAKRSADADRLLKEFEQRADGENTASTPVLLRSTLLVRRGQLAEAEKLLRDSLPKVSPKEQATLRYRVVDLMLRTKRVDEARRELTELAQPSTADPKAIFLLAELALESHDLDGLNKWMEKLRDREGSEGTIWRYFKAQWLLAKSKDVKDADFKEAQTLSDEIHQSRPEWAEGLVLQGQIAVQLNDRAAAITAYQAAIERGTRRAFVFSQLAALLYSADRIAEAEEYLKRLGKDAEDLPQLASMSIPAHLRHGDLERAVEIARNQAKNLPNDVGCQVRLGYTLLFADKKADAEAAFHRAVELGPADAQSWQGLLNFYMRTSQTAAARETLERIPEAIKLPAEKRPLLLARGYEALGDRNTARAQYLKAVKANPNDAEVYAQLARFYALDNKIEEAVQYERQALKLAPESSQARRALAGLLLAHGDGESLDEALTLVAGKTDDGKLESEDQRLKAMILVQKGGSDGRAQARKILEGLAVREEAIPTDRLLLARILEGEGHVREAIDQAYIVASRKDAPIQHVFAYAEILLRNARADEVGPWVERLIKESPNSFETLSIRTRWLAATGRRDEAAPLVEAFLRQRLSEAKAKTDPPQVLLAVGNLYDQIGLDAAAERCYRDLTNQTPKGYVPLASWLARHQRVDDAVSLCLQAAASDTSIVPAVTLANALIAGNASREVVERAEPLLSQAIASHADAPDLLFVVATLRFLHGRRDEAVSMFRRVLDLEPKNVLVRNNLASLLAERPEGRREALDLIDKAIEIGGESAELLDTKGMILLREDQVLDAIKLLKDAASQLPPDPRHLFHLSLAYQRAGKLDEAEKTLERARELSLTTTLLSPDERKLLPKLERDLGL
jgi:tetratricopeptide (TPR) repeat protein